MKFRNVKGKEEKHPPEVYSWRPAVYGVLIKNKKLLLIQPNWDNKYCLPGGSMELGETPTVALKREFLEETGYKVTVNPQPIFVDSHLFANPDAGRFFQRLSVYFKIELVSKRQFTDINEESTKIMWRSLKEISSKDFTYFQRDFLKTILEK